MTKCLVSYNSRGRKEDADNKKEKKGHLYFTHVLHIKVIIQSTTFLEVTTTEICANIARRFIYFKVKFGV